MLGSGEIRGFHVLEVRFNQDVVRRQERPLPQRLPLHHDRDGLVRDRERRGQFLAPDGLETDVHRDHDVDAHCSWRRRPAGSRRARRPRAGGHRLRSARTRPAPTCWRASPKSGRHPRARCVRRSRGPPRPRETASAARRSSRPRRPAWSGAAASASALALDQAARHAEASRPGCRAGSAPGTRGRPACGGS